MIDTATYTGLKKNKEYVITGVLMDKDTGEPALDPAGNQITATKTFKPKTAEGTEYIDALRFEYYNNYKEGEPQI